MPSDSHQDQWSSQWHQWHSSNPMMCTRPMPIMSYLGCCGTCHSLRRTCNTYTLHCQDSNCKPHLHDWHANVQARMLTSLDHLPMFLPLPFFFASSFFVPDSNVCTTTKIINAYNADTTPDAIQASTWWAEFNLVHKLVEIHGGNWYFFLQSLSKGEPLLCLNKLNKSTNALRTQQTTTPILDNVMCRNLSSRLVHQSSALIKLLLQWFHFGFQLNVSLLELWLCASLLCCTSSCWLPPRMSIDFIMSLPGESCVFACISAMNATRFSCRGDSLLINFCHHLQGFCIAFVGFRDNHRMILSLAMVQAQHYWSYMHNQQHTHTHTHTHIYTCK